MIRNFSINYFIYQYYDNNRTLLFISHKSLIFHANLMKNTHLRNISSHNSQNRPILNIFTNLAHRSTLYRANYIFADQDQM